MREPLQVPAEETRCPTPLNPALPHMTAPKGITAAGPNPVSHGQVPSPQAKPSPIHPLVVLPIYMDWEIFREGTDAGDRKGRASFTHKLLHNCRPGCLSSLFTGGIGLTVTHHLRRAADS